MIDWVLKTVGPWLKGGTERGGVCSQPPQHRLRPHVERRMEGVQCSVWSTDVFFTALLAHVESIFFLGTVNEQQDASFARGAVNNTKRKDRM